MRPAHLWLIHFICLWASRKSSSSSSLTTGYQSLQEFPVSHILVCLMQWCHSTCPLGCPSKRFHVSGIIIPRVTCPLLSLITWIGNMWRMYILQIQSWHTWTNWHSPWCGCLHCHPAEWPAVWTVWLVHRSRDQIWFGIGWECWSSFFY